MTGLVNILSGDRWRQLMPLAFSRRVLYCFQPPCYGHQASRRIIYLSTNRSNHVFPNRSRHGWYPDCFRPVIIQKPVLVPTTISFLLKWSFSTVIQKDYIRIISFQNLRILALALMIAANTYPSISCLGRSCGNKSCADNCSGSDCVEEFHLIPVICRALAPLTHHRRDQWNPNPPMEWFRSPVPSPMW